MGLKKGRLVRILWSVIRGSTNLTASPDTLPDQQQGLLTDP